MPYQRLNYRKRIQIETLIQQKLPIKKIADTIGVHRSTIYRELSKGQYTRLRTDYSTYQAYSADKGEAHAKFHRTTVGAQLKNGSEFQTLYRMPGITVFYCHPYSSWERGTNENQNGFIRRFIPKSTPIEMYTDEYIQSTQDFLNNYPRKTLNGKTAEEMLDEALKTHKIPLKCKQFMKCRKIT